MGSYKEGEEARRRERAAVDMGPATPAAPAGGAS